MTIRPGAVEDLGGGDLALTEIDETGRVDFTVELGPRTLRRGAFGRHMLMHELGHVVDNALISPELREDVEFAFVRAPAWTRCFPPPEPAQSRCVPSAELFADQFAFHATRALGVRSPYGIPPSGVERGAFEGLLRRAVPGDRTLIELATR